MNQQRFDRAQEKYDNAEDPAYKGLDEEAKKEEDGFADDDWAGEPDYDLLNND